MPRQVIIAKITHEVAFIDKSIVPLFSPLRIERLPGFHIAKPAFKDWMVDNPDG
jgi:hypothetical protein